MDVHVSIAARFVPETRKVWALHAGEGGRYFDTFCDKSILFLEIFNSDFSPDDFVRADRKSIRQKLIMSDAWSDFRSKATTTPEAKLLPPSRAYHDYEDRPADRSLSASAGNVISFFKHMQVGDLVLVPGPGGQYSGVYIGEITTPIDFSEKIEISDDRHTQSRNIKWLVENFPKRRLSVELSRQLENRHALIQIERSVFGIEIFSLCYHDFITTDLCRVQFMGPKYNSKDARDIIQPIDLISFLVASYCALEKGVDFESEDDLSLSQFTDKFYDKSYLEDLKISFVSPGKFDVFTRRSALAAALLICMPIILVSEDATSFQNLKIIPSASSEIPQDVLTASEGLMQAIGPKLRAKAKESAQIGQEKIGLHTRVSIDPTRNENGYK